jgi:hypothetical protein
VSAPADGGKLVEFIRSAKTRGADDRVLITLLRQNGWSERRISTAFSTYYEETLDLTIPRRGDRSENARDAFFYLLAFVTLGIWTVALVWLANILIDHALPSALDFQNDALLNFRDEVAGQLASLIVAFPIFLLVTRSIVRETRQRPESLDSGVRKWLTYVALVVTSVALLGNGVWFLQQFLLGDLTLRFVLKSAVLFLVAGGVLWYYLGTVRAAVTLPSRDRAFGWVATVAVAVAVALGFTGVGTPQYERSITLDQQRINNLRSIERRIADSYQSSKRLPKALAASDSDVLDPATHAPFRYVPGAGSRYRLCATFDTDDRSSSETPFWKHAAGETCYALDASNSPG